MKVTEVKPELNIQQILNKQNNTVFQSHYFHNSVKIDDNPEVVHTFFHDHPVILRLVSSKNIKRISLYTDQYPTNLQVNK